MFYLHPPVSRQEERKRKDRYNPRPPTAARLPITNGRLKIFIGDFPTGVHSIKKEEIFLQRLRGMRAGGKSLYAFSRIRLFNPLLNTGAF